MVASPEYVELATFIERKLGVNGPDVHMKTAGYGTNHVSDPDERLWRLAVYNCFCSSPPSAALYARWPIEQMADTDQDVIAAWLRDNWAGIPIRKNRRPMRSVPKCARTLQTTAQYIQKDGQRLTEMTYEEAWSSLDAVYTWGRYVKIKFLETLRRFMGPAYAHLEAPDIRATGGWSPRKALAYVHPDTAEILASKKNDKATIRFVHDTAAAVKAWMEHLTGRPISFYEFEALLCNFRQTQSGTFYAGRTIDSELEYHKKVTAHFGDPYLGEFNFFETRAFVFPDVCLGETQGWEGVRKELFTTMRDHGYVWSDVIYDYHATTDLANPVERAR